MSNVNLADPGLYELVNDQAANEEPTQTMMAPTQTMMAPVATTQASNNAPVPVQVTPTRVEIKQTVPSPVVKVTPRKAPMFKRSLGGFLLFVAIVVVLALCIYFTVYRLGWGVSECMNKNYHNCGVLLTPEVAPLALTGLAALI